MISNLTLGTTGGISVNISVLKRLEDTVEGLKKVDEEMGEALNHLNANVTNQVLEINKNIETHSANLKEVNTSISNLMSETQNMLHKEKNLAELNNL